MEPAICRIREAAFFAFSATVTLTPENCSKAPFQLIQQRCVIVLRVIANIFQTDLDGVLSRDVNPCREKIPAALRLPCSAEGSITIMPGIFSIVCSIPS